MELEDYIEKLQKQKKLEKKQHKQKEKDEKVEVRTQRKKLMRYTSSQKLKISAVGKRHRWIVFKERSKKYYNYPRGVVYLSCIPHGFFEEQMASYFGQFGKVTGIYMPRGASGRTRGYAFIEFQLEVIAKIVAETMNNYLFYQRILKAKYIPPAEQKPYMFVWPFADKRKKSILIEKELEKKRKPLSEDKVDGYKRKVEQKLNKLKAKMAAAGADYCIQISGEAPPPLPPAQPNERKLARDRLKAIAAEAQRSTVESSAGTDEKENPLDAKLAKQIKKKIAAKLARPLSKKTKKSNDAAQDDSESDDAFHSADDFETADETSFFNDDQNLHDTINADFDYDSSSDDQEEESPVKKAKVEKAVTPQGTPAHVKVTGSKSAKNTPAEPKRKSVRNVETPKPVSKADSPAAVQKARTPKGGQTPKGAKKDTPAVVKTPKPAPKTPKSNKKIKETIPTLIPIIEPVKTPKSKTPKSNKKIQETIPTVAPIIEPVRTPKTPKPGPKTPKSNKKTKKATPALISIVEPVKSAKSKTPTKSPSLKVQTPRPKTPKLNTPKPDGKADSSQKSVKKSKQEFTPTIPTKVKNSTAATPKSVGKLKVAKSVGEIGLKRKSTSDVKRKSLSK